MTDGISPREFQESEGVEDWRVLGEGACIYFRTESFAESAKLVRAIGELIGVDDHRPAVDVRGDGTILSESVTAWPPSGGHEARGA